MEILEPEHRPAQTLNCSVVLLYDIVEVLALANFNPFAVVSVVLLDGCSVGATFIDIESLPQERSECFGYQARLTIMTNRFGEKPQCSLICASENGLAIAAEASLEYGCGPATFGATSFTR